jgi:hypothetical protein
VQAQSRRNLCVWYSIAKAEAPFIFEIEGAVVGIERTSAATEVLVQEDPEGSEDGIVGYQLDDNLVRFCPCWELDSFTPAPRCSAQVSAVTCLTMPACTH